MSESPPKKAPRLAEYQTEGEKTYNADSLTETQAACKSKLLPSGFAFENGAIVPTTLPPQGREPLTELGALLRTISEAVTWSDGHPVKWTAFCVVIGRDERSTAEIAAHLGVSQRAVQLHLDSAKKWLAELRTELEVTP